MSGVVFNLSNAADNGIAPSVDTPTQGYLSATDLFGAQLPEVAARVRAEIPNYAITLAETSNGASTPEIEEKLLKIRTDLIFDIQAPVGAITLTPNFAAFQLTLPLSTGSVHVSLTPPYEPTDTI